MNKIKFEEINCVDSKYKTFIKELIETPIIYEQFSFQLEKQPFFDTFSVIDICSNYINKYNSDNFNLTDYSNLFLNKALLDLINIEETKYLEINKPKIDSFNFTDNFNSSFYKFVSENFSVVDSKTIETIKIKNDVFQITEIGTVLMSNYSIEGTYFIEDYVGTTTNF